MNAEIVIFTCAAVVAIGAAVAMVTRPNPVKAALFLIANFFCLAVLYLLLHAQFIAIIQILVYAGAIMVLFLFVIMLLNLGDDRNLIERRSIRSLVGVVLAAAVCLTILAGLGVLTSPGPTGMPPYAADKGTVEYVGAALFRQFLLPFEVTSLLLLAAMVGVMVLAKKRVNGGKS